MKLCPVILCGGTGTRLWPLSRRLYPKQFMDLGGHTLFGDTLKRLGGLPELTPPLVICNKEQRFLAAAQMQEQGLDPTGRVLLEPEGRNTAPAIAVAALSALASLNAAGGAAPDGEDVLLLVLPSDHVIGDAGVFARAVARAAACAAEGRLVTFGIEPGGPETGYGYIQRGDALATGFAVRRFVEKPRRDAAEAMLADGGYYWNSGMFLFRASAFLGELGRYAPAMLEGASVAWRERSEERDFVWLGKDFAACPADSIDYAVMEKTPLAAVVPLDAGWSDLGSWNSVYEAAAKDADANVRVGDVLAEDVSGSYLYSSGRLVAALGVRDLVVVETGDAVLVTRKECSQDVKVWWPGFPQPPGKGPICACSPQGWYETWPWAALSGQADHGQGGASLSATAPPGRAPGRSAAWKITVGDDCGTHADQSTAYRPCRLANAGPQPWRSSIQAVPICEDDIVRFEDNTAVSNFTKLL
ncbi:MAG: mannose-1-phosphate guanylyltransferase/mannose-6-phosphate isomerase [Desulfovibrio fairfieldensis]